MLHKSYIVWSAANTALITYNAALNRPAYQSSVASDTNGRYTADLANDGNYETTVSKDNKVWCAHSLHEANPWWAVDLGRPTTIYRVDFTNRANNANEGTCDFVPYSTAHGVPGPDLAGRRPGSQP